MSLGEATSKLICYANALAATQASVQLHTILFFNIYIRFATILWLDRGEAGILNLLRPINSTRPMQTEVLSCLRYIQSSLTNVRVNGEVLLAQGGVGSNYNIFHVLLCREIAHFAYL